MRKNFLYISYYLRPSADKSYSTIYLVPRINGTATRGFSSEITVKAKDIKNRIIQNPEIEAQFEDYKNRMRMHYAYMLQRFEVVTAQIFQDDFRKEPSKKEVLALYCQYIDYQRLKLGKGLRIRTLKRYQAHEKNLRNFLRHIKRTHITVSEISIKTGEAFLNYLINNQGFGINYAIRNVRFLNQVMRYAKRQGFIEHNPMDVMEYPPKEKPKPTHLTPEELDIFINARLSNPHLERVTDLFVFQCYTGLAYVDLASLNHQNHLSKEADGTEWITKPRVKNGHVAEVPLLPTAKQILEKYNYTLPTISNQKYNKYIKEIAEILGVNKKLTTHVARHTFAMTALNHWKLPLEIVSKMMGHGNIRTTQDSYGRILRSRIKEDTKHLFTKKTA